METPPAVVEEGPRRNRGAGALPSYSDRVDSTVVTLPLHIKWSGPRTYDLADPVALRRVYELVLREGTADDVRRYVDAAVLRDVLDDLLLPAHITLLWREVLADLGRPSA